MRKGRTWSPVGPQLGVETEKAHEELEKHCLLNLTLNLVGSQRREREEWAEMVKRGFLEDKIQGKICALKHVRGESDDEMMERGAKGLELKGKECVQCLQRATGQEEEV